MKILSGAELASYIKVRQAKQVRGLRQAHGVYPKLVIVQTTDSPVIDTYVRLKQRYGDDILVEVDLFRGDEDQALNHILLCNNNPSVHGIIVQLPLAKASRTQELIDALNPEKDVDGLSVHSKLSPATPMAINWLMAGYNIELMGKKIVIVGQGRLVGKPLAKMWTDCGYSVTVVDGSTKDMSQIIKMSDVIVSATGQAGIITSDMIKAEAVVVDAGTASENGRIVGDVSVEVRERHDLSITPEKGGVGPLTVSALFDNVITVARNTLTD